VGERDNQNSLFQLEKLSRNEAVRRLTFHENNGTLIEQFKAFYPEYILPDGSAAKFNLCTDLKLWQETK